MMRKSFEAQIANCSFDSFEYLWSELNAELKVQRAEIRRSFDQSRKNVPRNIKRIKKLMNYELSHEAYGIIAQEYKCLKSGDKYHSTCVCQLRVSHGLPCAHEIAKYVANQTEIPREAIHRFWWQLNINGDLPEDPSSGARAFIVDLFIMFREMSVDEQMRCKYAVKKILQSCEQPRISMTNDRSEDFFRKFFTCVWCSEPGLFLSEGISEIWGQSCRSSTAPCDSGAILQQFLSVATQCYYFNRHRKAPGTDVVTDLVFTYSDALSVLRAFPYVLIIDATCKENRYKIPFFEVLGITCRGKSFTVACVFIGAEREDNYMWVLQQISELCWFVGETPKTIVTLTDPDQALFNAVEKAFPHSNHLLGRHHIYKSIEDRCLKDMCANNVASAFLNACKNLFESKTENVYEERLAFMENDWKSNQGFIGYLKQTWLMPYKDKIVSAWTDKVLHFGTHTMNREVSALKKRLSTSDCSFDDVWYGLQNDIGSQISRIKSADGY